MNSSLFRNLVLFGFMLCGVQSMRADNDWTFTNKTPFPILISVGFSFYCSKYNDVAIAPGASVTHSNNNLCSLNNIVAWIRQDVAIANHVEGAKANFNRLTGGGGTWTIDWDNNKKLLTINHVGQY